ncbi:MAG: TonB family protein [Bacteroidota bacterium]|nr:TonB family protein [Bacteroidota bacterium]
MKKLLFAILISFAAITLHAQDTTYYNSKGKKVASLNQAETYKVELPDSTDKQHIIERFFFKTGKIQSEIRYLIQNKKERLMDGKCLEWYPNGQLWKDGMFKNGVLHGLLKVYSEEGKPIRSELYANNRLIASNVTKRTFLKDSISNEPFIIVEQMPQFPGGTDKMKEYLGKTIRYPVAAQMKKVQGMVIISFVVSTKGVISDIQVVRGIGSGCDEESVRVVESMPAWEPGKQGGQPVPVKFTLPIRFALK